MISPSRYIGYISPERIDFLKYYVGIDLGGTNIAAGVVDENYNIISRAKTPTARPRPADDIVLDCAKVVKEAVSNAGLTLGDIESVGIGSPGIVNSDTGVVEYANNLDFYNVPVGDILCRELGVKVYAENDANAAAYGEFVAGSAKGAKDAVCITLGTGVGGGIIIGGKILSGFNHAGAEIGHTVIEVDGPLCTCGRKGCFEVFSSATGLIRMTKEAMVANPESKMNEMGEPGGRTAFNAMRMGDEAARQVVEKYIKYLAAGITNAINIFQPEILSIGGGVCNEGDALLIPLKEKISDEVYTKRGDKNTKIVIASLGNDAGIVGAAFLGLSK